MKTLIQRFITKLSQLKGVSTVYSWLTNAQDIVDVVINDIWDVATGNTNIYVNSSTGDDDAGDGSVGSPYQTFERARKDIPLNSKYQRNIYLAAGNYEVDTDLNLLAYISSHAIYGATSVESSETISNIVATDADGIQMTVAGAGWTPNEHEGKIVKWTSGSFLNRYGVVYENTADTLYVTHSSQIGKLSVLGFTPAINDTFDITTNDTTLNFNKLSGSNIGVKSSRFKFQDLDITGSGIVSQSASSNFIRCNFSNGLLAGANATFLILQTCFIACTGSSIIRNFQNMTIKMFAGTVVKGNSNGIFMRDGCYVKLQGEVVMSNLDNNGISILGNFWGQERDSGILRWHNCDGGFIHGWYNSQDVGGVDSEQINFMSLPTMYGTLTGDYLIRAKAGDTIIVDSDTDVTTALGTNTCTCNEVNESYYNDLDGTIIYGLGKVGETIRQDINTTAQTIYVDTTSGDDDTGNGTASYPYQTIRKAYKTIPLNSQVKYTIDLVAGTYTLPNDLTILSQNDGILINGKKSVESSNTISGIGISSRANGIILNVAGTPWTASEHVGKLVKITSGVANNNWGVVRANTTNTITITTDDADYSVAIPGIGDTFDIYDYDVELQMPASNNTSVLNSIIEFNNCRITGNYTFATQMSSLIFGYCDLQIKKINVGHSSSIRINRTYFKPSTATNYAIETAENCTCIIERGSVIDGDSSYGLSINNDTNFRISGEVVFQNLSSDGFTLRDCSITSDSSTSTFRFIDCAKGFKDRSTYSGGNVFLILPYIRGNITGNYLVEAQDGSKYNFNDVSVTTALGTNICSANGGISENYENAEDGTIIYGIKDIGSYKNPATYRTATDYVMTKFDYYVGVTNTVAPRAITLPDPATLSNNKTFEVGDESGNAAVNNITITPAAGLINGAANFVINANYNSVLIRTDGTNYFIR